MKEREDGIDGDRGVDLRILDNRAQARRLRSSSRGSGGQAGTAIAPA
jgi:hypothetical protein